MANAYSADINQIFSCESVDSKVNLYLGANGVAEIRDETQKFTGSYNYTNQIQL